jgi:hypothetical protein
MPTYLEYYEAATLIRGAYEKLVRCMPSLPTFDELAVAIINELRYEPARERAYDAGRFEVPKLDVVTRDGTSLPVVAVSHVQALDGVSVTVTVVVVCSNRRVVEISRERPGERSRERRREGPGAKQDRVWRAAWEVP